MNSTTFNVKINTMKKYKNDTEFVSAKLFVIQTAFEKLFKADMLMITQEELKESFLVVSKN